MRPLTVTISTWIMAVFVASDWYVTYWSHYPRPSVVLGLLIDATVGYLVLRAFWQGRSWARKLVLGFSFVWVLTVLAIVLFQGLKALPWEAPYHKELKWAQIVFAVYMLFYLNGREARAYFGAQYQELPAAPQPE